MSNKEYLDLQLEVNDMIIMSFKGIITQKSIVELARTVEATLFDFEEEESKIRTIFEVIVEIMQNMLSYSYDSIDLGDNRYQSTGHMKITLNQAKREYSINSANLIDMTKRNVLEALINEANSLDADALKELYKERRKSRRKNHGRGAGLGFLDMARKSKNKLEYDFLPNNEESLSFELSVKI